MPKSLAEVLASTDDNEVCKGIYSLLILRYGRHFDPASIPAEHRHAFLVWHTFVLIGNGGFNGFFKADFPLDPQYAHTQAAYDAIGCEPVAQAVRRVFDAFTNRTPPSDPADRLRAFVRANTAVQGGLNRDFFKASGELPAALAAYVRKNQNAFADVEKPANPYEIATQTAAAKMEVADKIDAGVKRMPHYVRAAYYAHCARLVLPLWDAAWPNAPPNYRESIEQAIIMAEMCAEQGESVGELRATAALAVQAAEAAAAMDPKARMGGPPPASPVVAVNVALAAACAVDLVAGDQDADAYEFARVAIDTAGREDLVEVLQEHYQRLKRIVREGNWTDKTPVPLEIFRPDFESRGKAWWKRW